MSGGPGCTTGTVNSGAGAVESRTSSEHRIGGALLITCRSWAVAARRSGRSGVQGGAVGQGRGRGCSVAGARAARRGLLSSGAARDEHGAQDGRTVECVRVHHLHKGVGSAAVCPPSLDPEGERRHTSK